MEVLWRLDASMISALNEGFETPLHTIQLLRSLKNNIDSNADTIKRTARLLRNLLEEEKFVQLIRLGSSSLEEGVLTKLI